MKHTHRHHHRIGWLFLMGAVVASVAASPRAIAATEFRDQAKAVGIILGEPTGFTGKLWQTETRAWDAGISYSFQDYFLVYGDHLWHFPSLVGRYSELAKRLKPYVGLGAIAYFSTIGNRNSRTGIVDYESSAGLAIRIPVGLEWIPRDQPLGLFFELAPGVGIIPGSFMILEGGVGVRFYLKND